MRNKNIITMWLRWQFYEAPAFLWRLSNNYINFVANFFSFTQLIKSFFSPWHKYKWAYPKIFDIKEFFNTLISNIVSRILGALMRTALILTGAISQAFVAVAGLIIFIGWLLIPFVALAGILFAIFL